MRVLVTYASKHGATAGIAARIGAVIAEAGHDVAVHPVLEVGDVAAYDAFVVGSATYLGHWQREANVFLRENHATLAARPVWLFSSGPLGERTTDEQGRDVRSGAVPRELPEHVAAVAPREHHVFFGAHDPANLTFAERCLRKLPAGRELLPEGDFRDWAEIDGWAKSIADELGSRSPTYDAPPVGS